MVPSVIHYISILKTSVVLFYSILPSTHSYDDLHSTKETLDYVQDSKCPEGVLASHYLWSFRVNNVTLSIKKLLIIYWIFCKVEYNKKCLKKS